MCLIRCYRWDGCDMSVASARVDVCVIVIGQSYTHM